MTEEKMPAWPDEFRDNFNWPLAVHYEQAYEHERALREAWEARCRKAIATLEGIEGDEHLHPTLRYEAEQALAAIGPLPELPPERT